MMKVNYYALLLLTVILSGCANVEERPQQAQVIDRLSEEELARILPKPVSQLSFEALVGFSKAGLTSAQIIEKLKETDTSYDLTPTQMIALQQKGVDLTVLDYLHSSRQAAMQNNIATVVAQHQQTKDQEIQSLKKQLQQQRLYQSMGDPFCRNGFSGFSPYGFGPRFRQGFGWYY